MGGLHSDIRRLCAEWRVFESDEWICTIHNRRATPGGTRGSYTPRGCV